MALAADALIARRRLIRRVTIWRAIAILAVIGAIVGGVLSQVNLSGPHIARVAISGAIVSDRPLIELLTRLQKKDTVRAVVVAIDSPGGTSVGGERLYKALRTLSAEKPVVSHINTLGASAAYMTALGTDHIVAHRTSLTGSIGVLIQYGQVSTLLDRLGIEVGKVDSGPLKAEPNPFTPTEPAAVAALQSVVDDTFEWFLGLVIERRGMPTEKARRLADGRIYTGQQAMEEGLIDAIGGEEVAVKFLVDERDIPNGLPVRTYKPRRDNDLPIVAQMTDRVIQKLGQAIGVAVPAAPVAGSVDGLWSIWHAAHSVN
ncbi:MAG: signal peptide peptidase SppA [Pseudomonadota bacterium]